MSASVGAMKQALIDEGFRITIEDVEALSPALQLRLQQWLEGDRVFPRFLVPFYKDETISVAAFTDGEEWTSQSLGEEVADTLMLLGITVASPDTAFELISGFSEAEVLEAGDWTMAVRLESTRAAEDNRDVEFIPCPACIERLVAPPVAAEAATSVDDSVEDDTVIDESAGEISQPIPAAPGQAETREQAIARLQSGLHEVRQRYIERRAHYEDCAEAAKLAKKSMESAQDTLNDLVGELDDAINSSAWQARLPLNYGEGAADTSADAGRSSADDPAKTASIEQLVEFGISDKQAEKLMDADIETVAELEKRIREVNGWFRKIKGIGESAADKVADALVAWRTKFGYGE